MSIKSKIQALITAANATTGEADETLTDAVQTLVDGYGGGGLDVLKIGYSSSGETTPKGVFDYDVVKEVDWGQNYTTSSNQSIGSPLGFYNGVGKHKIINIHSGYPVRLSNASLYYTVGADIDFSPYAIFGQTSSVNFLRYIEGVPTDADGVNHNRPLGVRHITNVDFTAVTSFNTSGLSYANAASRTYCITNDIRYEISWNYGGANSMKAVPTVHILQTSQSIDNLIDALPTQETATTLSLCDKNVDELTTTQIAALSAKNYTVAALTS